MGQTSWRLGDRGVTAARAETDNRPPPRTRASAMSNATCTTAAPTSCRGKSASMASVSETRTATVPMPGRLPLPSSKRYLSKSYLRRLVHNFFSCGWGVSKHWTLLSYDRFLNFFFYRVLGGGLKLSGFPPLDNCNWNSPKVLVWHKCI